MKSHHWLKFFFFKMEKAFLPRSVRPSDLIQEAWGFPSSVGQERERGMGGRRGHAGKSSMAGWLAGCPRADAPAGEKPQVRSFSGTHPFNSELTLLLLHFWKWFTAPLSLFLSLSVWYKNQTFLVTFSWLWNDTRNIFYRFRLMKVIIGLRPFMIKLLVCNKLFKITS